MRIKSILKALMFLMILILLYINLSAYLTKVAYAENGNNKVKVYGLVFDYYSNTPLCGAKITVAERVLGQQIGQQIYIAETNASGFFEGYVEAFKDYLFFAYYDNPSTPGIDYVPAYREVVVGESPQYLLLSLLPGASINATEDPFFLHDEIAFSYEVKDENGILQRSSSVSQSLEWRSTGNKYRIIPIPANSNIKIEVNVYESVGRGFPGGFQRWRFRIASNFTIPLSDSGFCLKQGECITINLKICRLNVEAYEKIPNLLDGVKSSAEKIGILSLYEKTRIQVGEELLRRAWTYLSQENYINAYADLYESYLTLKDVEDSLSNIFRNSVISVYFITPFIGVTSSALGALLFKGVSRRILTSILIYALLIVILYFVYPGYKIVYEPEYNPMAETPFKQLIVPLLLSSSFIIGLALINAPYTYGERTDRRNISLRSAIAASFSLAAENLKRRKARTILVMSVIIVSVSAFMALTSYSYEGGLIIETLRKTTPSSGIFVFQQSTERNIYPFGPLDPEIIRWLRDRWENLLIVPLLKNVPQIGTPPPHLGYLENPLTGLRFEIFGVLGLEPSLEANMTGLNRIIIEGEFLNETDIDGILISREAKETLQANINEIVTFCGRNFTVVGVFESRILGEVKDLNGEPILPQKIRLLQTQGGNVYLPEYVSPESVVIILGEKTSHLPLNMVISRVNIRILDGGDHLSLARILVLLFPRTEAFVSMDGEIKHLFVGYRGFGYGFAESTLLLVLSSLNVGAIMLNSLYERRREIITLSTIGFNPSQISAVFICESLIIAFIAGSIGYLSGLTSYFFFSLFPAMPAAKYKAEAFWGILALSLSIVASVTGSLIPALKASILATPSLLRRFIVSSRGDARGTWIIDIPLKIKREEIEAFFNFMVERMKVYMDPVRSEERIDDIRIERDHGSSVCISYISMLSIK
ncbi:MAG: FtsX-like permease family protein [Candidatus Bathyarchaeia archaeon]